MKTRMILGITSLMVVATLLAPNDGFAQRRRVNDRDGEPKLRTTLPQRVPPPFRHHRHFGSHGFTYGPSSRLGVWPYAYGGSAFYDASTPAYAPSYSNSVVVYPPAPPPPPMSDPRGGPAPAGSISIGSDESTIVEYPHGRYELRGDGGATPYRWVWVPNPPPAAPIQPASRDEFYRWTDAQGGVHWADRYDAVPEQYRNQVRKPKS